MVYSNQEILSLINAKEKETRTQAIWRRMDEDFNTWNLVEYKYDENRELSESVTSNTPRTFANLVLATVAGAAMNIEVTPIKDVEAKREDARRIKSYLAHEFWQCSQDYMDRVNMSVLDACAWYLAIRGTVGLRVLRHPKDGDEPAWNELWPIDGRGLLFEYGKRGLLWVAHKMIMSKAQVEDMWDIEIAERKDVELWDFWTKEGNAVIRNQKFLKPYSEHGLGLIPITIVKMPSRPPIINQTGVDVSKTEADSIYSAVRRTFEHKNLLLSMATTSCALHVKTPVVNMSQAAQDIGYTNYFPGSFIKAIPLEGGRNPFQLMPVNALPASFPMLFGAILAEEQEGSLPGVVYGRGEGTQSGRQVELLREPLNQTTGPIFRALGYLFTRAADLLRKQFIAMGGETTIQAKPKRGKIEQSQSIKAEDVDRDVKVIVTFEPNREAREMLDYQMASMAQTFLANDTIREKILRVEDPDMESRKKMMEEPTGVEELDTMRRVQKVLEAAKEAGEKELVRLCEAALSGLTTPVEQLPAEASPPITPSPEAIVPQGVSEFEALMRSMQGG